MYNTYVNPVRRGQPMNVLWLALITGLTTGGVSCLAVQGGLLASAVSQKPKSESKLPYVGMFLVAKVVAYTLLGFVLGALGSAFTISPQVQGWMQIFAGLYMLVTAANLLNIHPIFRHFVIQPPKFAMRYVRKQSKVSSYFAPATLGALTVLIPCGITQGMMLLAVASGNALMGALIMLAFTIGTSPVFAILGMTASKLMEKKTFLYIASFAILVLGLLSINTGQILRGSVHTFGNYLSVIKGQEDNGMVAGVNAQGIQEVTINVSQHGYETSSDTLKANVPVKLKLVTKDTYSCAIAFTIPKLGITKNLKPTGEDYLEFTPTQKGRLTYSCSMGMYSGSFKII